jgi:hypothetical protein
MLAAEPDIVRAEERVAAAALSVPVNVGDAEKTAEPVPVSSVSAVRRFEEVNEPSDVVLPTDVIAPVRFALVVTVPAVSPAAVPVMLVPTRVEGVPKFGETSIGELAKTRAPVPVSSLRIAAISEEVSISVEVRPTPPPHSSHSKVVPVDS